MEKQSVIIHCFNPYREKVTMSTIGSNSIGAMEETFRSGRKELAVFFCDCGRQFLFIAFAMLNKKSLVANNLG